jgi:hypothetical protein
MLVGYPNRFFKNLVGYTKISFYNEITGIEISTAVEKICGLN